MTTPLRRATGFAAVGTLSVLTPVADRFVGAQAATVAATVPFVLIAVLALAVVDEGRLFELFARPGDREEYRLYGLASFALAVAGLGLVSTTALGMPVGVFCATVFTLAYGNLAQAALARFEHDHAVAVAGFVVAGSLAGVAGYALVGGLTDAALSAVHPFVAVAGALLAALLRTGLYRRDDALVVVTVAMASWLLVDLPLVGVDPTRVAVALAVTAVLGYVSYALETASVPGMLTGVLLGLVTIILGDLRWFAMLVTFFGLGGLSTKFRYDVKRHRGIAEDNEGARGSGNVLANSVVALVAVVAAAASRGYGWADPTIFLFAFAGAVAAALADTFSSEFGGLFDGPRLVTTLQPVEPGTDGAVTWQGELAGLLGAVLVAGIAVLAFPTVALAGFVLVVAAGAAGMTADSVLGATLEGRYLGNQGVNLLATSFGGLVAGTGAAVGLLG